MSTNRVAVAAVGLLAVAVGAAVVWTLTGGTAGGDQGAPAGASYTPPLSTLAPRTAPVHRARVQPYEGAPLPDRGATPGSVVPGVTTEDVCSIAWLQTHAKMPATSVARTYTTYGVPTRLQPAYSVVQLIPVGLGGSADPRNLWIFRKDNSFIFDRKRELDDHLHQLVCAHRVDLADAQHAIAANWVEAYATYMPIPVQQPTTPPAHTPSAAPSAAAPAVTPATTQAPAPSPTATTTSPSANPSP